MPWIWHIKTIPTYLSFGCTGLKSSGFSWVLCLGSHKAWIRVSAGVGSYLEAVEEELLPSSFRLFSSVQSLSHVQLFVTPWIAARQASQSSPKPMSIESVMPSHPVSAPSPPAPNPSQHQGLFQWVNSSHEVAKVLEFQLQHQSFQWTPRTDLPEFNSFSSFPSQASDSTMNPYNLSHFPFASSSALKGFCDYKKPT